MSQIADRYRLLADAFQERVVGVAPTRWSNRSPCEDWDARALVGHVVDVHGMMIGPLERTLSPAPSVADDPVAAFVSARADVEAVLDDPEVAGTEYDGAFGPTTVEATIDRFLGFDLVIHGWDLARATGQDESIDPVHVEQIWAAAQRLGDMLRTPGVCGPVVVVPDDAPLQDRLLGLLGRDPR